MAVCFGRQVLYCEACREACHPARGPLARHSLVEPRHGRNARIGSTSSASSSGSGGSSAASASGSVCPDHPEQPLALFCVACRVATCEACLQTPDSRHGLHDVQPLVAMCKAQKVSHSIMEICLWDVGELISCARRENSSMGLHSSDPPPQKKRTFILVIICH